MARQQPLDLLIQRTQLDPESLSPGDVLHLQRMVGNQAMGQLMTQNAQHQSIQMVGGSDRAQTVQRHRAEAVAYNNLHALGILLPGHLALNQARNRVRGYVNNREKPEQRRIGLRDAWNANNAAGAAMPLPLQIPLPAELNKPVGAAAQQAARALLYPTWLGQNAASTEHNIAQSFNPGGGAAPVAANLVPVATRNDRAAIGHDGGHFGYTLQGIVGVPNPPLYLSAWLWNRGMAWTGPLNEVFITHVIHDAAITDVELASPTFTGVLNGAGAGVGNLAAQRAAMAPGAGGPGGHVAGEIRRLLNAGPLSFYWNGVTLHR